MVLLMFFSPDSLSYNNQKKETKNIEKVHLLTKIIKENNFKVPSEIAFTISETIFKLTEKEEFSPLLIASIVYVESNFNPFAVSSTGARGLGQIQIKVHKEVNILQVHDIEYNIANSIRILKDKMRITNSLEEALLKYSGFSKNPKKGDKYIEKVFTFWNLLYKEFQYLS